jgi:hypothetical protein
VTRNLLDDRWTGAIPNFFRSTCTFQRAKMTKDAAFEDSAEWSNIAGFVDLPCTCAAAGGGEVRGTDEVYVAIDFTLSVPEDLTGIVESDRVVVAGPNAGTYDILLVVAGTQGVLSRASLRRVR